MQKVLKYTLRSEDDEIDLDDKMRIKYAPREGYTLHDLLVSYPNAKSHDVWFVWEKNETK